MNAALYYILVGLALFFGLIASLFILSALTPAPGVPRSTKPQDGVANATPANDIFAYYARMMLGVFAMLVCSGYGVFASIALKLVGKSGLSQWTTGRAFKWVMGGALGVWFDVLQGEEHLSTRPAVIIGNHQTELDVCMLGAIFPQYCSVTAKKQLKWVPVLGWFMSLSDTVFIDRADRNAAQSALAGAAETIRSRQQSVFMFPEGTRSYAARPTLLPFKKGAFHLAVQAGVPIVPVVVANYANVLHVQTKTFIPGRIPIVVLPPVSTQGMTATDVDALAQTTRDRMLSVLESLAQGPVGAKPLSGKVEDVRAKASGANAVSSAASSLRSGGKT